MVTIVLLQFGLMGLNLYGAKNHKDNGRNPSFSYFVAGMCFGFGLLQLMEIIFKLIWYIKINVLPLSKN